MVSYLYFPQCFAAGGRSGRLPASGPKKNILILPVVVTSEELLLLCMEQPHHITLQLYRDVYVYKQ